MSRAERDAAQARPEVLEVRALMNKLAPPEAAATIGPFGPVRAGSA
jgi:hypothetical protein